MSRLKRILYHDKKNILCSILLILILKLLFILPMLIFGRIIDQINQFQYAVSQELILLVVTTLVYCVSAPWSIRYSMATTQKIIYQLSRELTAEIFEKDFGFFKRANIGVILRVTERGIFAYEVALSYFFEILMPSVITFLLLSVYIGFELGFYAFLYAIIFGLLSFYVIFKVVLLRRRYIQGVNDSEDALSGVFAEVFMAAKRIKYLNSFDASTQKLNSAYKAYALSSTRLSFYTALVKATQFLLTQLFALSIILIGLYLFVQQSRDFSLGQFVVLVALSGMMMQSVIALSDGYKEYQQFKLDKLRLDQLIAERIHILKQRDATLKIFSVDNLHIHAFSLNISAHLQLQNPQAIKISKGQRVAIVGESGEGKSTLLDLIAGIKASSALIFLDNVDLASIALSQLAQHFAYAFQHSEFLSGSLHRAVFFDHAISLQQFKAFKAYAGQVGLNQIVNLDLMDEIEMINLSGGEIKRLDVLRNMILEVDILLLDEPTAALDAEIAQQLWQLIFQHSSLQNQTLICATHDRSYLSHFDLIIQIKNHRLQVFDSAAWVKQR